MRLLFSLLVICFLGISCAETKKSSFLQAKEISLSKLRMQVSNTIIDTSVVLSTNLGLDNIEIFYTNDGTEPSNKSLKYIKPLEVKEAGVYKFKAFHQDWKPSETSEIKVYKKGVMPSEINWHVYAHSKYPGVGDSTLINQQKASLNFRDSEWVGFDSVASATIHFKKKTYIKSMTTAYLVDTKSWIFPPKDIKIYLNGTDTIHVNIDDVITKETKRLNDVVVNVDKAIDSIAIELNTAILPDWHAGKGNNAWLFMDEWIFN